MLDVKKVLAKILIRLSQPYIIAMNITGSIPSPSPSGGKTITQTVDIPAGYEVIPNQRVAGLYVSGDAQSYFTDRGAVVQSGNVISFTTWLYNPNGRTSLMYGGSILLRRIGSEPVDPEPTLPFIQVKEVNLGTRTISANANLAMNTYDACIQACPSGYTYVGVAGFSSNHGAVVVFSARPVNSQYAFELKNTSGSNISFEPRIWALYCRNSGA